jgi:hypothetical protein
MFCRVYLPERNEHLLSVLLIYETLLGVGLVGYSNAVAGARGAHPNYFKPF